MKVAIKRNLYSAVIFVLIMLTVALHYNERINIETFIALTTSLIAFYIGMLQQKLNDDGIFKELFQNFNLRYDEYNDLINTCERDRSKTLTDTERNKIVDYFNLCAEEYLWYAKGRIPNEVWTAWKKGIIYNIGISQINEVYNHERKQNDSYYGLFKELEKK